jgi:hypothetical protein
MPVNKKPVTSPEEFNADAFSQAAIALHVSSSGEYAGQSPHAHRKGQLILSLRGAVSCKVEDALWLVPPGHAVWFRVKSLIVAGSRRMQIPTFCLSSPARR